MDLLAKIAEQKIREAMEHGEFDDLAYHGKPLKLEDLSGVPEHLRMGYKILKDAGMLPPEMQLKKEMLALQDLLKACYDEDERRSIQHRLSEQTLRYDMLMERHVHRPTDQKYVAKVRQKLARRS